jgi:hypothetical protein
MRASLAVLTVAIAGCAQTHPSPDIVQPQDVRFISGREALAGCAMLGVIDSRDLSNGGTNTSMPDERNHFRRLQNEAAKLSANVVLLTDTPAGMNAANIPGGAVRPGEAYRCERPVGGRA